MFKKLLVSVMIFGCLNFVYLPTEAAGIPASASSKVCNATTKVCVSNVTNPLTVKDEELLNACKQCCTITPTIAGVKGCIPRCQKSCTTAYKKELAKAKKGHKM